MYVCTIGAPNGGLKEVLTASMVCIGKVLNKIAIKNVLPRVTVDCEVVCHKQCGNFWIPRVNFHSKKTDDNLHIDD